MYKLLEDRKLNVVAFLITIALNAMANGIPLNGQTTGEVSAQYQSLFTPAGFTFSIWGVIYLFLTAFVIYQMLAAQKDSLIINSISLWFKLSCIANAIWILAWHYNLLFVSLILMATILISLLAIYGKLYESKERATVLDLTMIHLPFSLYAAWICVASIANISVVQIAMGWDDWMLSAQLWTLLKLALAGAIGAFFILRKNDIVFGLVVAWAAYGISVKQLAFDGVSSAATMLMILLALLAALKLKERIQLYVQTS